MILAPIGLVARLLRTRRARVTTAALAVVSTVVSATGAQFSSSVELVEVYASVAGGSGPLDRLEVGDFVVTEEGRPRPIQAFARGDFPLSVVLAVDRSFSMAGPPLRQARQAGRALLASLRPDDEALVVAVGSEVEAIGELSRDRSAQRSALDSMVPWGTTSLHDAIVTLIDRVARGRGRRALILLSDGQDRYSRATAEEVLARGRETDVLIYGIALGRDAAPMFGQLAALTGGRAYHIVKPSDLGGTLSAIHAELRTQYLLGYAPGDGAPGWRAISVTVKRPGVQVRARSGYVAR